MKPEVLPVLTGTIPRLLGMPIYVYLPSFRTLANVATYQPTVTVMITACRTPNLTLEPLYEEANLRKILH